MFRWYVLIVCVWVFGCSKNDSRHTSIPLDHEHFEMGEVIAKVKDKRLVEASGLASSVANSGHLWTHNDSGGTPSVYLIDQSGQIKLTVRLEGARNLDWEDITSDGRFLYIGDIGDNRAVRSKVVIYRFREPTLAESDSMMMSINEWEKMVINYTNGSRDVETLMYDYQSGELVMVSKRDQSGLIYSFQFKPGKTNIEVKDTINLSEFTAGDISPSGEIILKNYDDIFYWAPSALPIVDRMSKGPDFKLRYITEPQGEAITFDNKGNFFTLSEHNPYTVQKLYIYKKK